MSNRLTLDANIIGYWGFDEALETDNAIDESQYADAHLTVTGSPSVQLGRVGAARTLSSSAYATVSNARLRVTGDLTMMVWFKMVSVNNAGSLLRCILSCGGPTTGDAQNYALYVDASGRLVYKHTSASGEVIVRTATNTIRLNQFYYLIVVRSSNTISFFLDNFSVAVADVTVGGVGATQPVPAPSVNASASFNVGRSLKETDSAFWDGPMDEISLHDTVRPYQPYLKSSYFRVALRNTTLRLSASNSVISIASADMGSGVRWWCYEQNKDLYVVKESPFGFFGSETRLTTPGGTAFTSTTKPELIYNSVTDTLLVVFVAGNRIFKLTASSTDDPATINMPFTADAGIILKLVDNVELFRAGEGYGGQREFLPSDVTITNRTPVKISETDSPVSSMGEGSGGNFQPEITQALSPHKPIVAFLTDIALGFGIVIGSRDSTQNLFKAYKIVGGAAVAMANPVLLSDGRYFAAIPSRVYGVRYVVESLSKSGTSTGIFSEVLDDRFGELQLTVGGVVWLFGVGHDGGDSGSFGEGYGGQREFLSTDIVITNRTPVKLSLQDDGVNEFGEGYGGQQGSFTQAGKTVMT